MKGMLMFIDMRLLKLQQKVKDILKIFSGINMDEDKIRTYDELENDEKEVLDVFRQMKLMSTIICSDYTITKLKI